MAEKIKNGITELVFILDKSGSMAGLEEDTIGGFNSMIEKQKKLEGKVYVSTVLFSGESSVLHDRVPIDKIQLMTDKDYEAWGSTALYDAVGGAVNHIKNVHKYARPEDVPEHTLFVITTDGMENASRRYDSRTVKKMIREYEKNYGWEFLFVAANIDAAEAAENIGIRQERAANYNATRDGTDRLYGVMSEAICEMRVKNTISENWSKGLDK